MPYIKQQDRSKWSSKLTLIRDEMTYNSVTAGELNFMITSLCHFYLSKNGHNYQTHCEIEGVLQGASKEFYRKLTAPYEEEKIEENGDLEIL